MELWKDIRGYEGRYQVSNTGRVKSLPKTWITNGSIKGHNGKILSFGSAGPYLTIQLYLQQTGKPINKYIHILVAEAFIPNPLNLPEVNHLDGDKHNNYYKNLERITEQNNTKHAYKTGLKNSLGFGKKIIQLHKNRTKIKEWDCSMKEVSNRLKISNANLCQCLHKKAKTCAGFIWEYQ